MAFSTSSIFKVITEDLEKYQGRRAVVRANLVERMTVKKVNPHLLHPNPEDEFCDPDIGPNDMIMDKYCRQAEECMHTQQDIFPEPVLVSKMEEGGYLLLNGHHRWGAAMELEIPELRISIVNPRNL